MIKVQNVDKTKLAEIGKTIGEAFMAEPGVLVQDFTLEDGIAYFSVLTEICYNSGCLYSISENHEGFVAYWTKNNKPPLKYQFSMLFKLLTRVKIHSLIGLVRAIKGWTGYEETYKNEHDYVAIFMLVVPKAFQGQGHMRTLLSAPFALAKGENIPCLLDTDAKIKADKYEKCGMKIIKQMSDADVTMYLMRFN